MRIAIVTGASSGIGKEFVKQIAATEQVDEIWSIARRLDRLEQLKKNVSSKIRVLRLDLLQQESIRTLKELLEKEKPKIALLVNASGFGKYGSYLDLTDYEIDSMIDLNCKALIHITYACLPYMNAGSRILMMGSASAYQPLPYFNMYAATKVFVVHFSRALNAELKERGITVTSVCPGYVRTEFFKVAKDTKNPDACNNFKPMYDPDEVVKKALSDSRKRKDMSVFGIRIKLMRLISKLLPHRLVMEVWLKIK
jgi:short-subunit dehydrogenase